MRPFSPFRKLASALILLFLLEFSVMALINVLEMPVFAEALLDSSALILLSIPVLYLLFIGPMIQQYQTAVEARKTAETLQNTSTEFARTLDLDSAMNILIKHLKNVIPFDVATIYTLQSPYWMAARAAYGYQIEPGGNALFSDGFDPRDNPIVLRILTEQKSIAIQDTQVLSGWAFHTGIMFTGSWLGIPLIAGGKVIGLCGFGKMQFNAFLDENLGLAEGITSQAAVAVQNAILYAEICTNHERLRSLTHKLVALQESERRFLAKDLYDEVGQAVVSVLYRLRSLENNLGQPEELHRQIDRLDEDISSISDNLHTMAVKLRPATLEHLGLGAAIQQELNFHGENYGLKTHFESSGLANRLPEELETALYRIVRETLSNVVEHSRASQVEVFLRQEGDLVTLVLEDDGIGFNLAMVNQKICYGLLDMQERADMIGGDLSIETSPGNGTAISIQVPLKVPRAMQNSTDCFA